MIQDSRSLLAASLCCMFILLVTAGCVEPSVTSSSLVVTETDRAGTVQWVTEIKNLEVSPLLYQVSAVFARCADGGYIVAESFFSHSAQRQLRLIRTDHGGTVVWDRSWPTDHRELAGVIPGNGGDYLVFTVDGYLIRADPQGSGIRQIDLAAGTGDSVPPGLTVYSPLRLDTGTIAFLTSGAGRSGGDRFVTLAENGTILGAVAFARDTDHASLMAVPTSDSNALAGGMVPGPGQDIRIYLIDHDGNPTWNATVPSDNEVILTLAPLENHRYGIFTLADASDTLPPQIRETILGESGEILQVREVCIPGTPTYVSGNGCVFAGTSLPRVGNPTLDFTVTIVNLSGTVLGNVTSPLNGVTGRATTPVISAIQGGDGGYAFLASRYNFQ